MHLSFEDQQRIIGIVLVTMNRDDLIIGGDFALGVHELRDASDSERVCFYYSGSKIDDGSFGAGNALRVTRGRMEQFGYPSDALTFTRSPKLQFEPPLYVDGPADSRVISFEDAVRIKIESCSNRSEALQPGDFFDLYQISEKLGKFGIDGFVASRIDQLNVENLRANLRRTSMDPSWARQIRAHVGRFHHSHSPDDVLSKLATLQRDELPITTATIRLSHAIASRNGQQINMWRNNLRIVVANASRDGFQPQFIPPTPGEILHSDRPVSATSQAADVAREEIAERVTSAESDGYNALPNYRTGAILGILQQSSRPTNTVGATPSDVPSAWQKTQSPRAMRGPSR
ncbi:hypothetical protein J2X68_008033 [Streptomyces sp. 3330]|nr:hypothetical protein [Streptomyces sp. 3330]